MKVLVATPYRKTTNPQIVERSTELYERLTFADKERAPFENDFGYSRDYTSNAQARNALLKKYLFAKTVSFPARGGFAKTIKSEEITHVLWVDVDVVEYPPDLIERLMETAGEKGIAAPVVLLEYMRYFYDTGAFIQDGKHANKMDPYFDVKRELDSVGTCYLVPADVYRESRAANGSLESGAHYEPNEEFTEHYAVMQAARARGYKIRVNPEVKVWHAFLPNYGMPFHHQINPDPPHKGEKKICFVEGCAGLWGSADTGDMRFLPVDIAESLVRGGLAVEVDADGNPIQQKKRVGLK